MILHGTISKLKSQLKDPIEYAFRIGEETIPLNPYLGKTLSLEFTGNIFCIACGKKTKKSFQQGYCYVCSRTVAAADLCIVRPEKCHHHLATCREPEWGTLHCMIPHIVYLANTSQLKVGITREPQIPTRWIDQGATQALAIARVKNRLQAGLLEIILAEHISDRTDWRALLKGNSPEIDLQSKYQEIKALNLALEGIDVEWLNETPLSLQYPVLTYPEKVKSISLEKEGTVSMPLLGIKGQYLILEQGVMNIRNLTGYEVTLKL